MRPAAWASRSISGSTDRSTNRLKWRLPRRYLHISRFKPPLMFQAETLVHPRRGTPPRCRREGISTRDGHVRSAGSTQSRARSPVDTLDRPADRRGVFARAATTAFSSSSRSCATLSTDHRNVLVEPEQHVREIRVAKENEDGARLMPLAMTQFFTARYQKPKPDRRLQQTAPPAGRSSSPRRPSSIRVPAMESPITTDPGFRCL